jgi:hypothetical protein
MLFADRFAILTHRQHGPGGFQPCCSGTMNVPILFEEAKGIQQRKPGDPASPLRSWRGTAFLMFHPLRNA